MRGGEGQGASGNFRFARPFPNIRDAKRPPLFPVRYGLKPSCLGA
jgi:hypothetical protein